jgi:hypothetical protein
MPTWLTVTRKSKLHASERGDMLALIGVGMRLELLDSDSDFIRYMGNPNASIRVRCAGVEGWVCCKYAVLAREQDSRE